MAARRLQFVVASVLALGLCEGAQRSGSSQFVSSFTAQLQRLGDAPLSTLACLGPRNSGKGQMLGKLLGTAVDDEEGELECVISDDDKVAVLNSAGFGERPGSAGLAEDSSDTAVAVALSQTLVYTTFFREFLSDPVDAVGRLAELRSAMELLIRMGSEPGAPAPRKRSLILVVREYEPESGVEAEQLRQTFTGLLQDMWAKLPAGRGRAAPPALSDVIDVQIAPLPPAKGDREGFSAAVQQLQTKLRSAVRPDAAPSATELLAALAAASKLAGASLGTSAVSPAELAAALACARAANAAFDEYISASAALHGKAAQARPPETLADESSAALNAALAAYDEATAAHGETEVCAKRRAALKAAIMTDLRSLYSQALLFAKQGAGIEMAKRVANITASDGSNFHADLQTAVNEIMADFKEKAAALRMEEAEAAWSYGLEERMLQQELQQFAAEMVRRAQLKGIYAPAPSRVPTGVALHWLHPNPFGKDLRNDQLSASDRLSYSQRAKSLLRLAPMSTSFRSKGGKSIPFKGGVLLTDEDLILTTKK